MKPTNNPNNNKTLTGRITAAQILADVKINISLLDFYFSTSVLGIELIRIW